MHVIDVILFACIIQVSKDYEGTQMKCPHNTYKQYHINRMQKSCDMDCSVSQAMGCFLVVFHGQVTQRRQIVVRWKAMDLDDTYKQYHINCMQKSCDMDCSVSQPMGCFFGCISRASDAQKTNSSALESH